MKPDSICAKINAEFLKASRMSGCEPCPGPKLETYLRDAGFKDIKVQKFPMPIGPWPLDLHLVRTQILQVSVTLCPHNESLLTLGVNNTETCRQLELSPAHAGSRGSDLPPLYAILGIYTHGMRCRLRQDPPRNARSLHSHDVHPVSFYLPARLRGKLVRVGEEAG